jgi:hypothetical protein
MNETIDYPSDIRSKALPDDDNELREWCREVEEAYPFLGACWNCKRTETLVILPDIGEVRCYCGCTVAKMIDGKLEQVEEVWDE